MIGERERVTIAEFDSVLDERGYCASVWGQKDETILDLEPFDDVLITVWDEGEVVVFEDIVRADKVWETLDYLAVLIGGGLL